jgi:succinate dehydrogenase hydrophobic anchor subunit
MARVGAVLVVLLLIFAVYAVIVSPEESAAVVKAALSMLGAALAAVGRFFSALVT